MKARQPQSIGLILVAATCGACTEDVILPESTTTKIDSAGGSALSADGRFELRIAELTLSDPVEVTIRTDRDTVLEGQVSRAYQLSVDRSVDTSFKIALDVPWLPEETLVLKQIFDEGATDVPDSNLDANASRVFAKLDWLRSAKYAAFTQGRETCTRVDVPTRILAIIDTSESNVVTDPMNERLAATAALFEHFSAYSNVQFAIVTFDTFARAVTLNASGEPVFTRDPTILADALNSDVGPRRSIGFTNYLDALSTATDVIAKDSLLTREDLRMREANGENTALLRPYYFVIFLSDGRPHVGRGQTQSPSQILDAVNRLTNVDAPALGLTLHTAFLGAAMGEAADPSVRMEAIDLLQQMAATGRGTFANFANGDALDFSTFAFEIAFDRKTATPCRP